MRNVIYGPLFAAAVLCLALGPAAAGEVIVVKIAALEFSPATVKARVGDIIEWVNEDFIDHTATADDGSFDVDIPAGKSQRLEMKRSGGFPYFCRAHPNMRGTLNVAD